MHHRKARYIAVHGSGIRNFRDSFCRTLHTDNNYVMNYELYEKGLGCTEKYIEEYLPWEQYVSIT